MSSARLGVHVVAFSSSFDLPEQVASLRSLLRFGGQPESITVVSDGSHSERERSLLCQLHDTLTVVRYDDFARGDLPDAVMRYAAVQPMGKKLMTLASLRNHPTLYMDSDVLFFPGARDASAQAILRGGQSRYMPGDWEVGYDTAIAPEDEVRPANAGFLIVAQPLDWDGALARMPDATSAADLYVEQTLVHVAMREAGAVPLPGATFALHREDQFAYRDDARTQATVLRHYVSITRHKFWLAVSGTSLAF